MKKIIIQFAVPFLLIMVVKTETARAQFFKDIINTVKQTAQSRANTKTTQTTNQALDKVDPSTQTTTKSPTANNINSPQDSAATNSVLGAFAKAAAQNPNDTSSADLTMKALGIMTGGGGISAQDSIIAINRFKTANGGSGFFYEYKIVTSGKKISTMTDSSRLYFTNSGEGRGEMRIPMPGMRMNEMISIARAVQPSYTLMLYPDSKTYSLNIIDSNLMKGRQTYRVDKVGSETVLGYACTHSKLTTTTGSGMFKSTSSMDIWTSTSVPGYSLFEKMANLQPSQSGMLSALENAGCGGIMVKIMITGKDYNMEEDLIQSEEKNCSADLFKIPTGYTESKDNMFSHMMTPANK